MEKLNKNAFGLTLASTSGIIYLICAVLYSIAPSLTINYGNYIFHGLDISSIITKQIAFTDTLIGLILITISGYLAGVLFATLSNYFNNKYGG